MGAAVSLAAQARALRSHAPLHLGWWSVAWFEGCGINQLLAAYRADERQRCADEVQALAELRNPASWEAQALREAAEELARGR
ncbi:hypothetical protein [Methylogaea oryzae]|uniref:hypothetical protein n=1 Tax=Methylogaea oryzae TaxID=1295382 RepID=UPI0006D1222A|nr:hypothetical protein [Methylogaea oryzae]